MQTILCKGIPGDEGALTVSKETLFNLSAYFRTMMNSGFKEGNNSEIILEKSFSTMKVVLEGWVVSFENVQNLLEIAEEYMIIKLQIDCEQFLISNFKELDPVFVINLGCEYNLAKLKTVFSLNADEKVLKKILLSDDFVNIHPEFESMLFRWRVILEIYCCLAQKNKETLLKSSWKKIIKQYIRQFFNQRQSGIKSDKSCDYCIGYLVRFFNDEECNVLFKEYLLKCN